MEKLTQEQLEKYVRERWEWVAYFTPDDNCDVAIVQVGDTKVEDIQEFTYISPHEAWLAAAEYTRQHERKIAEKREEISFIVDGAYPAEMSAVRRRILAVLESQLAELLRGWRQR